MADEVATGAATGAAAGAAAGSVVPGWGTLIGGVVGGAAGAIGGLAQKKKNKSANRAKNRQEGAIREEMRRRATGIAEARQTFGDVNSYGQAFSGGSGPAAAVDPSAFQNLGKTLTARSTIQGQIDQEASTARDAGRQNLTASAQQAAVGLRGAAAERGLMGSSLDTRSRQELLGGYAGARSTLAGNVDALRQGAWNEVKGQQRGFEQAAGGGNINPQMGALSTSALAAGARGQMGAAMAGNLLGQGLGAMRYGMLAEANGGQGIRALGLPSLGLNSPTRRGA